MNNEERPPYVVFETIQIEDRAASLAAGHHVEKDLHIANITRPGSRDTLVKDAEAWIKELKALAKNGQIPVSWPPHFEGMYKTWLSGETAAVNGTPIKGWSQIGNAMQKLLINAGIVTVEDLASLPDGDVGLIGTGAISVKAKAVAFLKEANGTGKLVQENAAMKAQMDAMQKQMAEMAAVVAQHNATQKASKGV